MKAADLGKFERENSGGDDGGHLDEELDHVDDEDAPEAGVRGERGVEDAAEEKGLSACKAEQDAGDFAGGQIDAGHDETVKEQPEIHGTEAADHGSGFARV